MIQNKLRYTPAGVKRKIKAETLNIYLLLKNSSGNFLLLFVGLLISIFDCNLHNPVGNDRDN